MRKALFSLLGVAALLIGLVSVAGATNGAQKATLYNITSLPAEWNCVVGVTDTSNPTKGFAIMNRDSSGNIIVVVSIKRGTPNTAYDVWVEQNPGTCPDGTSSPSNPGAVMTNGQGNGTATFTFTPLQGATNFWLTAWAGTPFTGANALRTTAVTPS